MSTKEDIVKACAQRNMTVRVSVSLEHDYKLRVLARQKNLKKSDILHDAIEAYCDKNGGPAA